MKLVECVPNFSEGRDLNIIKAITDDIESVEGVKLLDVDPGKDTNRTVVTFVGTPDAVVDAAFAGIRKAAELIDMSGQSGAHPRMGATDVCPFIPVLNTSIEECVELAKKLGKRVADELNIPVYLYEYAATEEKRRNLAVIREGEYEGFFEKIKDPQWKPDFGKAEFNKKSGGTVIGVRDFLIAYNFNLNTKDRKIAHDIALTIREKGRSKRDDKGNIVRDENGKAVNVPGLLKSTKAIGWYIDDYQVAQISMNLTNYKDTPVYKAFDTVVDEAMKRGVRVTGSELVGLIPKEAIIEAGKHYLKKQGKCTGVPEKEIIHIAVKSLGLDELGEFDPEKKIIEYAYVDKCIKKLKDMKIDEFSDELSGDSPAPGGGSVAALAGVMAASLVSMVANLTHGKKGYEEHFDRMEQVAEKAQVLKDRFIGLIDRDTDAFNSLMAASKLPKKTDEQKEARDKAVQEATKGAINIPVSVMESCIELLDIMDETAEHGNKNSVSDAGVAALNAISCCEGAYMNVLINLPGITDNDYAEKTRKHAEEVLETVRKRCNEVTEKVYRIIG